MTLQDKTRGQATKTSGLAGNAFLLKLSAIGDSFITDRDLRVAGRCFSTVISTVPLKNRLIPFANFLRV
jgi:hypothetical protein